MLEFGALNHDVMNREEIHLPCVVLVDTSGSMDKYKDQLQEGLVKMVKALTAQACGRVEFCVIGFDDDAHILIPFGSVDDIKLPRLNCGGLTAMHAAVDMGLGEMEARKEQYRANQTLYYRPWIFMLTDGGADDEENGSFDRLLEAQKRKHCIFFPVGIGEEVDKDLLKHLKADGIILTASKEDFKGAFAWLGHSLNLASNSNYNQKISLANPGKFQLEIEI